MSHLLGLILKMKKERGMILKMKNSGEREQAKKSRERESFLVLGGKENESIC